MSGRERPTRAAGPTETAAPSIRAVDRPESAPETSELRQLRRRIDAVDRRIVALLNERASLAIAVGRAKRAAGWRAVRDPDRERDVLDRIVAANAGPLPEDELRAVYRRIIAASRALEADHNGLAEEPADGLTGEA